MVVTLGDFHGQLSIIKYLNFVFSILCSFIEPPGEDGMAFPQASCTPSNPIVSHMTGLPVWNLVLYLKLNRKPQLGTQN